MTSRKDFQVSPKGFKIVTYPQVVFSTWLLHDDLYTLVLLIYGYVFQFDDVFDLSMLQVKNFYGLFCSFTEYIVYSLLNFPSFSS